jgi:Flp pilus assembly protein TadD
MVLARDAGALAQQPSSVAPKPPTSAAPAKTFAEQTNAPPSTPTTSPPQSDVDKLLNEAAAKGEAGDYRAALELFQRAAEVAPDKVAPRMGIAIAALELKSAFQNELRNG